MGSSTRIDTTVHKVVAEYAFVSSYKKETQKHVMKTEWNQYQIQNTEIVRKY